MNSKNTPELTIPCHWDRKLIEEIEGGVKLEDRLGIKEVYGSLPSTPMGHGRASKSVKNVTKEEAIDFRLFLKQREINFVYLFNAPFKFKDEGHRKEVDEHIQWVLGEFCPDALTITSRELMGRVRSFDKNIPIHISTIAGVKDSKDLEQFLDVNPVRVVPHHDCGKRWDDLKGIVDLGEKNGIEVEMLSTESCLFNCPQREGHYNFLANECEDGAFHKNCNARKLTNPRELLLAGGIIRPEDEKFYEEMGVKFFKITGRSKSPEWLPEVVDAYRKGSYEGNLIRLLGIDPSLEAEKWIYIDNKALDGFIENFPQTKELSDEIKYADSWISKLYNEGEFKIMDGTKYVVEGEELVIKELGEKTEEVINNELRRGMR